MVVLKVLEICLAKGNLAQSWHWKQNGTTVVAALIILEVVNNRRSRVTDDYFEKKDRLY